MASRKERILERLRELGAEPKRSLGQNFLISDHVVSKILAAVNLEGFTDLVEVGPGLGALTEDLLSLERPIALLELDGKFAAYWRGRAERSKVSIRVIECDALQEDWSGLGLKPGSLFVSNLPYQISSSIVIERSIEPAGVSRMILMFQKEVAQRLAAKPSSKDYGLLTVIAQAFWDIRTVCDASPGDFFPPPNVASRVLMFKRRTEPFSDARAAAGFLKFAKAAFSHRRKLLSRNLIGEYFGGDKSRLERIEAVLAECGLKSTARAEELDPKTFVRLYESFKPGTNS